MTNLKRNPRLAMNVSQMKGVDKSYILIYIFDQNQTKTRQLMMFKEFKIIIKGTAILNI